MVVRDETGLFIGGSWRWGEGRPTFRVENPATEEVVGEAVQAREADAHEAIEAAVAGFASWRETDPWRRSSVLRIIAGRLREAAPAAARTITLETGKPLRQAIGEVMTAAEYFDWFADEARRIRGETIEARSANQRLSVDREPVGVVAVLTSWNFPINLPARKIAAALAAGCTVICRPSEEAPASTAALFRCMQGSGLPDGAVNLLLGHHHEIVPAIMRDPRVRKVSFTGSTEVGRAVMRDAARTVKKVGLELGGHASAIVFEDADVDEAVSSLIAFKFRNAGQICISPSRFFIQDRVYDQFVSKAATAVRGLRVGDGFDEATDVGPLINRRRWEAVQSLTHSAAAAGGEVLAGGMRPSGLNRGHYFAPTLIAHVPDNTPVMSDEPFGPIIPLNRFATSEDVIARANTLEYGLANYVYTRSLATAHRAVRGLQSGMIAVNNTTLATVEAPFGGVKQSGFRHGGRQRGN